MMPAHDVAKYFVSLVDEEAGNSITDLDSRNCSITRKG